MVSVSKLTQPESTLLSLSTYKHMKTYQKEHKDTRFVQYQACFTTCLCVIVLLQGEGAGKGDTYERRSKNGRPDGHFVELYHLQGRV